MACSKQPKIETFFGLERVSSKAIVMPIINKLLTDVFKRNKAHVSVNQATLAICKRKRSFPWLSVVESQDKVYPHALKSGGFIYPPSKKY
jgi:hypothetical protein